MPGENKLVQYVARLLSDRRTKVAVRAVRTAMKVKRMCTKCGILTDHAKHEDESENSYYFCDSCGTHN